MGLLHGNWNGFMAPGLGFDGKNGGEFSFQLACGDDWMDEGSGKCTKVFWRMSWNTSYLGKCLSIAYTYS